MAEHPLRNYGLVGTAVVAVLVIVFVSLLNGGGQTSKILSTVGSAVGAGDVQSGAGSGSGDTTGSGGGPTNPSGDTSGGGPGANAAREPPTPLVVRTGTPELGIASLASSVAA